MIFILYSKILHPKVFGMQREHGINILIIEMTLYSAIIVGHAITMADKLISRDRGFYRIYFNGLKVEYIN